VPSRRQHGASKIDVQSGQLLALHVDVEPPVPVLPPVLLLPPVLPLPPRPVRPPLPLPVPPAPLSESQPVPAEFRTNPERQSKSHALPVHFEKPLAGAGAQAVHGPAGSQPIAGEGSRHRESPGQRFCSAGHVIASGASPASTLLPDDDRVPPAAGAPPDCKSRCAPLPASCEVVFRPPLLLSPEPPDDDVALDPPLAVVSGAPPLPSLPPDDGPLPPLDGDASPRIPSSAGASFDSSWVDAHATAATTTAAPAKTR
jgi:hypothetical protein